MDKILLLYKSNHASHRVVSSTMESYKWSSDYKSKLDLHEYCIGKRGAKRLDRYLTEGKFDIVYIHEEFEDEIRFLITSNIDYITYTRADFSVRYAPSYSYVTSTTYTLIKELLHKEKQKHGKIDIYTVNADGFQKHRKFKVDYEQNKDRWFIDEDEANEEVLRLKIKLLEDKNENVKRYENIIKREKSYIRKLSKEIENLRRNCK